MLKKLTNAGYTDSAARWIIDQINAGNGTLDKWVFRALDLRYRDKINTEH